MQGAAKQLFFDQRGSKPWKRDIRSFTSNWPFLEQLVDNEVLSSIDLATAHRLAPNAEENIAAFISYLSAALQQGHVCIYVTEDQLLPNLEGAPDKLKKMVRSAEIPNGLLCKHENHYYFPRFWEEETQFLRHYQRIQNATPSISFSKEKLEEKAKQLVGNQTLLPEQAEAIRLAATKNLLFICGGPGTGKTYTAGKLLAALSEAAEGELRIALAAPTGKAASNLQASLKSATVQAKTLHSLVSEDRINANLVVIDESSMIDVSLMRRLFTNLRSGTKLILLGDPFQLPPIETGALFTDLVTLHPKQTIQLNKCLRAELQEIIQLAETIKNGETITISKPLPPKRQGYPELLKFYEPTEDHLSYFQQFRILTPMRKGPYGLEAINELFYNHFLKQAKDELVLPIMITKNDPNRDLYNGETGILIRKTPITESWCQKGDYALFPSKDGGELRKIPGLLLPQYTLAYCLSIHKSQGSEFDHVLLIASEGSERFGRELLYTGVTRAKKGIEIWGEETTLNKMIQRSYQRLSGLKTRIL